MNQDKQKIAIAEMCKFMMHTRPGCEWRVKELPDYLNDLNAMAEAEETLTDVEFMKYAKALHDRFTPDPLRETVCAKAAVRAEYFLKTKGLWKP